MSEFNYKAFYERVGAENGWNFGQVIDLNLYKKVAEKIKSTDIVLDIGSGGGEDALTISDSVLLLVGIDFSLAMIETARTNQKKQKKKNARFLLMDAGQLYFPDKFFDWITCRHSEFNPKEVYRVLKEDGMFVTQQVSENDKLNIKQFFGRGQAYEVPQSTLRKKYLKALKKVGFKNVHWIESNLTEYYSRPKDLIFLLQHTPIIPHFGEYENDFQLLDAFIQSHMTKKGIITNTSRFMITANR